MLASTGSIRVRTEPVASQPVDQGANLNSSTFLEGVAAGRRMAPRKYDLGRRKIEIEATRTRILEAARSILGAPGDLRDFTMDSIAKKAGVSRMTVFNQFGSQEGLLEALSDRLALTGGLMTPRDAFATSDPRKAVADFIGTFVHFWNHHRVTLRRMRALGQVFPSFASKSRGRDAWRTEHLDVLMKRFHLPTGSSRAGVRQATLDTLTMLTSFETFDALCTSERPPDKVAGLLTEIAIERLGLPRSTTVGWASERWAKPTATLKKGPRVR